MTERQISIAQNALEMSGLFITAGKEDTNVMTTHWGGFTQMWNRQVFVLPVRKKKYTHELIEKNKCFVINVPHLGLDDAIYECDHLIGRDIDKFTELGLTTRPAKSVPTVVVKECRLVIECKVIMKSEMDKKYLDKVIAQDMYINKETHTLFFGQVINCYMQKFPSKGV